MSAQAHADVAQDKEEGLGATGEALYRLMAWLSPAYPVGAYSYSGGLEWAIAAGDVGDAESLRRWIVAVIAGGNGFVDAVLCAHAHRIVLGPGEGDEQLRGLLELAAALAASKERHLETTAQGRAFLDTTCAAWPCPALDRLAALRQGAVAYPVAVGVAAAGHGIPVDPALTAFLHALAANLVSAGMRLVPLGQTDGARVLAACEGVVAATRVRARACPLEDIGGACFRADIAGMRHETQYTRLFRS